MKRKIFIFLMIFAIMLTSCENITPSEPYASDVHPITQIKENTETPMSASGTSQLSTTDPSSSVQTGSDMPSFEFYVVGEYDNLKTELPFERFCDQPKYRRANEIEKWKHDDSWVSIAQNHNPDIVPPVTYPTNCILIATVLGYKENAYVEDTLCSKYYVHINRYGMPDTDENVYLIMAEGSPDSPYYGIERIEIGDRLFCETLSLAYKNELVFYTDDSGDTLLSVGGVHKIFDIDGEEWIYDYDHFLLNDFNCAVKIMDEREKQFYKTGTDDDIIEYMNENGIPMPTHKYKCRLDEMINEYCWNFEDEEKCIFEFCNVGDYSDLKSEIPFEKFSELPADLYESASQKWKPKASSRIVSPKYYERMYGTPRKVRHLSSAIIVTVLGYLDGGRISGGIEYSRYYVHITRYGTPDTDNKVYIMEVPGTPESQYYGNERILIGDKFLTEYNGISMVYTLYDEPCLMSTTLYRISEVNREEWVFDAYGVDFSKLDCAVEITDDGEKNIYRAGIDDDVISYMNKNNIKMPEHKYKCPLDGIVRELCGQ